MMVWCVAQCRELLTWHRERVLWWMHMEPMSPKQYQDFCVAVILNHIRYLERSQERLVRP